MSGGVIGLVVKSEQVCGVLRDCCGVELFGGGY